MNGVLAMLARLFASNPVPPIATDVHPGLETRIEARRRRIMERLDRASADINRAVAGAVDLVHDKKQ